MESVLPQTFDEVTYEPIVLINDLLSGKRKFVWLVDDTKIMLMDALLKAAQINHKRKVIFTGAYLCSVKYSLLHEEEEE